MSGFSPTLLLSSHGTIHSNARVLSQVDSHIGGQCYGLVASWVHRRRVEGARYHRQGARGVDGPCALYVYCATHRRSLLQRRLPRIGIPLRPPDPDLVLDVQALCDRCYDNGGYEDFMDYRRAPTPPLELSDAEWAALWLQAGSKR